MVHTLQKDISDIISSLDSNESLHVTYVDNLMAVVIRAEKRSVSRDINFRSEITVTTRELVDVKPEFRDIFIISMLEKVLTQVRDAARKNGGVVMT